MRAFRTTKFVNKITKIHWVGERWTFASNKNNFQCLGNAPNYLWQNLSETDFCPLKSPSETKNKVDAKEKHPPVTNAEFKLSKRWDVRGISNGILNIGFREFCRLLVEINMSNKKYIKSKLIQSANKSPFCTQNVPKNFDPKFSTKYPNIYIAAFFSLPYSFYCMVMNF